MLPFVKPSNVRRYYGDNIQSYTDAVAAVIADTQLDDSHRNILITHQFVTGATRSESEDISVGGSDNVDASVFAPFDYVALGHIHGPQSIGRETLRYCGTPLKYSFSEKNHIKSVTVLELFEKGNTTVKTVPLKPLHDMREIRGTYAELTDRASYTGTATDDYLKIVLTDEDDIYNPLAKLRTIYPNIMRLEYDNKRTQSLSHISLTAEAETKSPLELFNELYKMQNGQPMTEEQLELIMGLIKKSEEEELCDQ
jgi:exonuclease SbcD